MYLSILSIGVGASLGAWLRWIISLKFNPVSQNIALGTVLVNLIGAFIVGFSIAFLANVSIHPNFKLFLITGFCGALTTFSTFSLEIMQLLQTGKIYYAMLTIIIHVIGSLLFTGLGIYSYQLATTA